MRFTRAKKNSDGGQIKTLYKIVDGTAEAVEFAVDNTFRGKNIPLKELSLKENILITGILRRESFIIPKGDDIIKSGDRVIVVTVGNVLNELNAILK